MLELRQDRSMGELFAELGRETSALVRREVALAKAEVSEKAARAGRNTVSLALGAAIGYAALLAFAAAAAIGLAQAMPWWLAALLVGAALAIVAGVMISKALKTLKEMDAAPRQTVETLKEDVLWLKAQMR